MEESGTPASTSATTTLGDARAALALADSSSAPPATEPTSDTSAPAATVQAAVEPQAPESVSTDVKDTTTGEPPRWRWQDILANARETSAKEAEDKVRQQYQWAQDIAEQERDGLLTWRAAMNGDAQAVAHLKANPQVVQWLKGLVAEPAQAPADPEPEPDLQAQDGTLVYSAPRQREWREWNNRQLTSTLRQEFQKELQPFKQTHEELQQQRQTTAFSNTVSGVIAQMARVDPAFETHKAAVGEVIKNDPRLLRMALEQNDPQTAIELAWGRVYREKVLPAQQQQSETQVLAHLQQRAVAAQTSPAAASSATPTNTLGDARAALEHASRLLS